MAEGFVVKPPRGWLHPDSVLAQEGVDYTVRYIGCLEVMTSMKKLDFETRSLVAKECIVRVCEAAGLKSADKKRRVSSTVQRALAERPRMSHSGANVALTISSRSLTLARLDDGDVIARHEMPRVSFASGGEADTLDFVAYVGKSGAPAEWRACYVVECGGRLAQDVISTIGQAFELRFKEFLTKPSSLKVVGGGGRSDGPVSLDVREYYNDMPGKTPPEQSHAPTHRHLPAPFLPPHTLQPLNSCEESTRHYVNQTPPPRTPPTALLPPTSIDMFDMHPFTAAPAETAMTPAAPVAPPAPEPAAAVAEPAPVGSAGAVALAPHEQAALLAKEPWFHGPISRSVAEQLVVKDGEFLVRESCACAGQFVLTGVRHGQRKHLLLVDPHGILVVKDGEFLVRESCACAGQFVLTGVRHGQRKHLLLVDPHGIVRTKDRVFDSVPHLIKYHSGNELPIVSADSALLLLRPVLRRDSH